MPIGAEAIPIQLMPMLQGIPRDDTMQAVEGGGDGGWIVFSRFKDSRRPDY